jgi:hypothetical protein
MNDIMKNLITRFALLLLIFVGLSCSKQGDAVKNPIIDENNLSACPINGNCKTSFMDNADVNGTHPFVTPGTYKVFSSIIETGPVTRYLFVKVPQDKIAFEYNKKDILVGGAVKFVESCPACNLVPFEVIDAYAKGVKLETISAALDRVKWLLEVRLIRQVVGAPTVRDTVNLKQYFQAAELKY